jgi:hypothetical protein
LTFSRGAGRPFADVEHIDAVDWAKESRFLDGFQTSPSIGDATTIRMDPFPPTQDPLPGAYAFHDPLVQEFHEVHGGLSFSVGYASAIPRPGRLETNDAPVMPTRGNRGRAAVLGTEHEVCQV